MLYDAIKRKDVAGIPKPLIREWSHYTTGITSSETEEIISWINSKFDEVKERRDRVQPSGWLGSGFDWTYSPLLAIYRECKVQMPRATDEEIENKSGQIFGLFVSLTLAEHRDDEKWYFVKGDEYQAHGVPIKSRIYFLPEE